MNPRKLQLLHLYSFASMTAPVLICTHGGVALWPMQEPPVIVALNQNLADAIGLSRSCLVSSLHIQLEAAWADHRLGTHVRIGHLAHPLLHPVLASIQSCLRMPCHAARGSWPPATCAARRAHRRSSCSTRTSGREARLSALECSSSRAASAFFFAGDAGEST